MTHLHSAPSKSEQPAYTSGGANNKEETLTLVASVGATLVTVSSDIQECEVGHQPVIVLADAWHGRFALRQRTRSRTLLGFVPETLVVVATAECVRAVTETLIETRHTHLVLVGHAEKLGRSMPPRFFERMGNRVSHFGAFRGNARQRCRRHRHHTDQTAVHVRLDSRLTQSANMLASSATTLCPRKSLVRITASHINFAHFLSRAAGAPGTRDSNESGWSASCTQKNWAIISY
jgi:hypothetical protein